MPSLSEFLIISMAVWRLSHFLAREDGPFLIAYRLRLLLGVKYLPFTPEADPLDVVWAKGGWRVQSTPSHLAQGITCVWCNSYWIAIAAVLFYVTAPTPLFHAVTSSFALSAAAIFLNEALYAFRKRNPA
jgi:hypothetical protein